MPRTLDPAVRRTWLERIRRQSQSDLTVVRFCASEEISVPSFYYWKKKLRSHRVKRKKPVQPPRARFLPVVVADTIGSNVATLKLPGGAVIDLPQDVSQQHLANLIGACVDATTRDKDGGIRR